MKRPGQRVHGLLGSTWVPAPLSPQRGKGVSLCSARGRAARGRGGGVVAAEVSCAERLGARAETRGTFPSLLSPLHKIHSCPAWGGCCSGDRGRGRVCNQGFSWFPLKQISLLTKIKGPESRPVFALGPVAFILLHGAGSQVPNWRGPSGFKGEIPKRVGALAGCPAE